ncbi:pericentrin isoform X15 [Notamacropus eugenii]|uniref:pericentrin isoform X15 n=1 Tax=Notamacropus eugenii TaxID=9315 RepID=UPI003B67ECB1
MEYDEQEERRRKVEAGRAKLAQFRQRKTKGDSSSSKKKASKRKSTAVHAAVTEKEEECTVTPPDLEQSVDSRGDGDCAEGRASALEAKAETELSNLGTQKKPLTELAGQEQIFKDGRSSLTTDPSEPEVPSTQGKMKTLEERLESEQDDLDLLSQEVDEFQAQQAQCSGAAQVQQELEAAVQERDQIIVRLTSTLQRERQNHEYDQQEVLLLTNQMHALQHQLRENSELLKNKMPARGGSSWPQSLAAAPLQCPPELHPPQQNIEDKENTFAQMEDLLKSTIQEPSQVVEEEEGLISGHQEQLSLDEDIVSLPGVLLGKDLEIREFKQGEQDCVEKFQAHPQKEAWRPLQDRRWDMLEEKPESGMTDVRKACGDAVNGKYREASGPTRPGVPPVAGLRERQPPGLGGVNINLKDQLQESDPCRESQRAAFQKERGETEQMEKSVLEGFQEKLPFVETHSEQAWDSKGDQGNWGEETQKLSSGVQGLNGLVLQVPEKSRGLQLECIEDITTGDREPRQLEQEEIGSLGGVDAQKAELKRMQSKLCLPLAEPLHCELEHQTVLQRCNLESEEDQSSKIDLSEDDPVIEPGTMDGETSVEGLMMEGAGDLMEKYLVCTEREDHSNASDTAEYFDIETALQSKSERESQDFIADELIIGFSEKMDLNVLSVGNSAKVESLADSVTNTHFSSDLSQGDLSEIYRLMDKDKVYLMQRCVKFNQLLREKELTFRNFSPETEETEERLWEGRHRLPFGPHLERGSSLSCNEIFSSLEEEGENQIEPGAATGSTTDLQGSFSVAPQTLPWPGMAKVFQKEVERQVGKLASDLMHLEALRCQEEDRLQDQLGAHKARSQVSAGHPGQKTTLEKTLLQKLETLKAEIALKENLLTQIVKEKDNLEKSFSKGQENLEENILELTEKIKCLAKGQEHEKREFSGQSECGPSEVQKLDAEVKAKESDFMQAENNPIEPTVSLRNAQEEPEWWLLGGMRKAAWALEDIPSELSSHYEKQIHQMKHQHEAERAQLRREHQKEVEDISEQMKAKLAQQQQRWNEERKEQIGVIKKIHEREHDREIAELICKHKDEMKQLQDGLQNKHQQMMDELQQHLGALHETELQQAQLQAQTLHSLELEALRLSLSNLHTAQLELTQANLHKEKETALVELREMLNDKRAQEVALVQSRQQYELEHIKEQHRKETEEMTSKHQQDLADLEKKLELEKELHAQMLEKLKGDWDLERGLCLRRLEEELAQKHQAEVEGVREALRAQLANQKAELEKMGQDKAQAEAALRSEQAQHRVALQDLRQELQLQHDQYLEDMNLKFREKQQKLDSLQASYEELQAQSREEIQQLWSQLDSTRANRQELNELKEQLLARASHVEQMEHLKHDFEEQQQRRRSEHESELEQLRLYFEQKLRAAEESYREDLYLLHQRLQEVREDSFLDSADVSWSIGFVEEDSEVERKAHLEQLMLQLEQHKEGIAHLRLQLEEKHRDELDALKASLETDHKEKHVAEMERERRQHCRDLEELRAHLTEEHRKEIIKVRLQCAQDAARQVEAEVAERVSLVLEEDRCKVAQLQANEGLISRLKEEVSLARTENAELQEKLQCEICLKEEAEKMRCHLVEDHQKEINKMREEIEQMICKDRDKEEDWHGRCRDLSRKAEERLATLARELNGKAQQEQQALSKSFDLHIMEMKQLQDQQEADIARLEQSLRQRDESRAEEEAAWQAQATQDLEAAKAQMTRELELATRRLQEDCALKLQTSRERFLEEQKETTQKLTERQDALFRQLQDKHASELQMQSDQLQERLRQQIESLTIELQTQHQEEMDTLRASLQSQHQAQLDAHMAELQTQHQEEMDTLRASLQSQHQARLDARVAELQTQHQEEVDTLRASLESQHQAQLDARVAELQTQHQEEVDTLRASLQSQHQAQLDARVAELQTQHQEEVDTLRASLQSQHQAQLDARVAELETQHQEEVDALRASLQSQHQAQLDARVTELQTQHAAEISVLEAKHLSNLDSLESCYLSEIQTMQGEQSHALESLQVRLEEQLRVKEAEHQVLMAQETEKHKQEQQLAQENLRIEMTANHIEKLKTLAAELQDAHQEELQAALHSQRCFLEEENHKALDRLSAEVLSMEAQHRQALQELKDIHVAELEKQRAEAAQQLQEELGRLRAEWERDHKDELEMEKRAAGRQAEEREKAQALCQREKEALTSQLQEQSSLIVQLKEKVLSLSNEVAETHGELEKLQERREREHEEGTNLISLLRSDMDHTQHERKTLQETNQRLLSLFGDTLKAAIAMKSQISKRIGIYLDEDFLGKESTPMEMREQPAQDMCQLPGDTSPQRSIPPLEFDQTLPECDETLLAATDISSHVRESFFWSPGVTVECEQPIRRIYQSLGAAVDNLLEMMLDSSKQLEETRELHARFEKEFHRKNEETAQAVRQYQELMDCLNQESAAKNQLALELHKAEGLAEGYRAEKVALEEALMQKEKSEHHLAVEVENLRGQLQSLTQEQARLMEEQGLLLRQKETLIVEAEEKATGLLKEVEHLIKEQSEAKQQSEKDCSTLRSQMRTLELELEDQLSHNQELAQQAAEIQDLKQQIVSLDKHLRNQRQFMDEQAVEREHERDDFQQEIRKLEERLKQQPPAKSQLWGEYRDSESLALITEVESLQRKLREKIDELNELAIKKELAERQLTAQKEEIRNLTDTNTEIRRTVSCLEEELEKQKKIGKELRQDKEALQEQQMNNLIQISTLQSKLDEAKHVTPSPGSSNEEDLKEKLEAEQAAVLMKEREVLGLKEELEQLKITLTTKSDELLQLNLELALQNSQLSASVQELSSENADFKALLQSKEKEIASLNEQIKGLRHESLVEEQSFSTKDLAICREAGLQRKENVISILTVCQKHLESELIFMKNKIELSKKDSSQIQQKPMESYQLHKEDLIIQVRHIQEKLHHLIKSVSRGDSRDAEGWTQLSPQGPSEQPMVASPPQRPHRCVSRTAQGQSPADPRPPASQGPDPNILCLSWDSPDNTKSYDPPGHVRHKFKLEQSLDSFPSSPSGDLYDADPLTSDCSCFEERAPPLMKSQDTPPADGGKFPLEPSEESAHGSPSSACSAENGSQDAEPLDTIQHFRDTILDMETSSLGSPELVRKDSTLEGLPSIHLTPLSQAVDLQSPDLAWQSLALQDSSGYLGYTALPGLGEAPPASQSPCYRKKSQPDASRDIRRRILEKDGEDFIITLTDSQADLQSKVPDLGTDNKGRDASSISDFPDKLKQNSERRRPPHTHLVARLQKSGMVQRPFKPMKEKLEMQSKQMKALLKMVCDESQQILVLSKAEASGPELGSDPLHTPLDCFQKERQGLLDAVQALKDHLTKVPPRSEEKEPLDAGFDWGDFLQAVQEVLEKERNVLKMELQSKLCNLESGDERSLLEKLEDVVKEQGELQKRTLENLHLSDRSSLLSEIQALRAQLRMTHLQNQEKLQQLYEALTNVEDHGSKQEYQFRRQIELLEYKVEQERCLVSDLQKTLTEEQEKGTENQKLLLAAQNATQELKSELEECKHEKETLAQSLRDAQKEAAHLRSMLENKEQDLQAALDMLQGEKQKAKELQALVEEEQRQSVEKEELSSKAIEELQASLDKQRSQNGQLAISLQHEQAEKDNLKKELQIEYSRCEALLCQERSQVCELQRALEAERSHSVELSEALSHERLVTEQLSKRAGEACTQKEAQLQHAFMRKLKEEKARAAELQALLADARQQGMASQKQLELEVHMHQEELKKEKEVSALLQASADALHTQKQELLFYLEEERAKQGKLQSELELFQTRLKEEASKETKREKEKRHEAQAEEDQGKKDKERLGWQRELELQRQRDEHKIQQLQQTIIQLEKDKGFMPSRAWQECGAGAALPPAMEKLQGHHDQLENVRQQLLHAVSLLTSFMNQTVNRTINDWTSSNEKAVMSLLLTLEELKSELMSGLPQEEDVAAVEPPPVVTWLGQKHKPGTLNKKNAQAQISLLDVLLKENGSLTKALSTMTQEKLELCRTVAKLEKTLKHHLQKGCGHIYKYVDCVGMLQKADKAAWKQQKMALQGSRHGESGMVKAAFKSEASHGGNTCRIRMEKLYLHFLRAESFRKALVYQKRYLLLLIGGFQDSEQETLSMIAHLGVFPSKMDKRAFSSRPFTKFRTAVRVVIAILRLRFLVKKWQELDRRGTLAQSSELDSVPEEAMEISRQPPPQPLSSSPSLPETTSSPPTQDLPVSSIKSRHSPSPTYRVWDRALTSPSSSADVYDSSQDPEHSLTEYIHHLEVIQQRLGGVQPELSSKKPGHQKTKKMNP